MAASVYVLAVSRMSLCRMSSMATRGATPDRESPPQAYDTKAVIACARKDEKKKPLGHQRESQAPTVHMDFQIHISPEAGAEQIDAIFAAMAKHLYSK